MYIESLWILCPMYIWVGLLGGGTYVNTINNLLDLESLTYREKESAISLYLLFNDVGIIFSALFSLGIVSYCFT